MELLFRKTKNILLPRQSQKQSIKMSYLGILSQIHNLSSWETELEGLSWVWEGSLGNISECFLGQPELQTIPCLKNNKQHIPSLLMIPRCYIYFSTHPVPSWHNSERKKNHHLLYPLPSSLPESSLLTICCSSWLHYISNGPSMEPTM